MFVTVLYHSAVSVPQILQQLQSNLLAFFRVKLRGENIVAPETDDANLSPYSVRVATMPASTGCG